MSCTQFCDRMLNLDMHGLVFETSICYWQDQPGCVDFLGTLPPHPPRLLVVGRLWLVEGREESSLPPYLSVARQSLHSVRQGKDTTNTHTTRQKEKERISKGIEKTEARKKLKTNSSTPPWESTTNVLGLFPSPFSLFLKLAPFPPIPFRGSFCMPCGRRSFFDDSRSFWYPPTILRCGVLFAALCRVIFPVVRKQERDSPPVLNTWQNGQPKNSKILTPQQRTRGLK